jgi:hypothetical protein
MSRAAALRLLSEPDRTAYSRLQALIARSTLTSPRHQRVKSFTGAIDAIRQFVMRDDPDDRLRGMVCGMYWLPDGIAVDVHEVRLLVPRCKSSINGSLHKLGYTLSVGRLECAELLTKIFPLLRDQTAELRKWSIRKMEIQRRSMVLPILPVSPSNHQDTCALGESDEIESVRWDDETAFDNFFTRIDHNEFKFS